MEEYKDMLGKVLRIGQTCINVFVQDSTGGNGERIGHRLCEIIKINPASVRIRYTKENGKEGQSNIYHTTNRLIVLHKGDGHISGGENEVANRWEILDLG